jgi:hypothetical protein
MGYKIVLNRCYGGFGISEKAVEWLQANGASSEKVRVQDSGLTSAKWVYTVCVLERHDTLLVKCVETLGEAASGDCARLEIVEIDQPLYRITEYDGAESIEEPEGLSWSDASKREEE